MRFLPSVLLVTVLAVVTSSVQAVGYKHCKNNNIALTFDDGFTKYTRSVVDQLVAAGQHATFCINLHNYVCNYDPEYADLIRHMVASNMTLCNHSAGHPHMTTLTDDEVREQIKQVHQFTMRTVGVKTKLFRFPYGESDERTERIVKEEFKMKILNWSIDTEDSLGASPEKQLSFFSGLNKDSSDIILMHDTSDTFVHHTFPKILEVLKKNKVKSSGMGKCLKLGGYKSAYSKFNFNPNKPRKPNWTCANVPVGGPHA